ncbi:histidinol-phosphate transaminase [Scytonema millei]|uniref:Histidinol-phosphate aminotransferase n=1 Tax=Scytonema millei VB511283 TaxID=1245923 RepID=A0A9X5E4G8_9CYAN|nr:histidinol-phosphate transaminase [Scytonema millei]NHC35110.1 histidinol-phosphate transaminase [Scytonema millei VB511283]
MTYFRHNIEQMSGYVPGEQIVGANIIKINSNENPYPPSPLVLEALRNLDGELLRRYPEPMAGRFRTAVSAALDLPSDWIIVGNGSDELLGVITRACTSPQRQIVCPMPTYVLYRTLAQIQDAEFVEIPYDNNYNLPLEELIAANGAVTFIASPHSPSGTVVSLDILDKLAAQLHGVLVIDEAYVDFATENALELAKKHDNVIILRTLSKGYSLAGIRLGFAVANPTLIAGLMKVKDSYNVDAIACIVGVAALQDQAHKNANAEKIKTSRVKLASELQKLNFDLYPSQANFLLARSPHGNAEYLYHSLKTRGILVRYFPQPRLEDKLRITVGTDEQNAQLVKALAEIL